MAIEAHVPELLFEAIGRFGNRTLYREKKDGEYVDFTYAEIGNRVKRLASAFIASGLNPGDRIGILSANNSNWPVTDYASLAAGLVNVPLYPTLLPENVDFILKHSGCRIVMAENQIQAEKVLESKYGASKVEKIIVFTGPVPANKKCVSFESFIGGDEPDEAVLSERMQALGHDTLATIVYTTGTTGIPKGVALTHGNILHNVEGMSAAIPLAKDEILLSFLPLSHVFERVLANYTPTRQGATIAYAEDITTLPEDMQTIKPTIMAGIPRFYEKIHAKILDTSRHAPAVKRMLFDAALRTGLPVARDYLTRGKSPDGMTGFKYNLARKIVLDKIYKATGGRIRFFISGGAPLSRDVSEFFSACGMNIVEGYGLTETSPTLTCNRPKDVRIGSVGKPLPNVEMKIADDGEILAKGPNLMSGYYMDPAATAEVIDKDGWFHTGDIGHFDDEGYLFITDRKKNIIVTAGGKNIAPVPIEKALMSSPYIEHAVVVGDREKFCSALLTLDREVLTRWAETRGITGDFNAIALSDEVSSLIEREIEKVNMKLARYETIKRFRIIADNFTLEGGELTAKLDVRRKAVIDKYHEIVDGIYREFRQTLKG